MQMSKDSRVELDDGGLLCGGFVRVGVIVCGHG